MLVRLLPAAFVGLLLTSGAVVSVEACSSFEAEDDAADAADATEDATALTDSLAADDPVVETSVEAGPFCATQVDAALCADFETPPLERGWTGEVFLADAGVLELLDGGAPASPMHAVGASIAADPKAQPIDASLNDAAAERSALLVDAFPTINVARVSVDLDVRIEALPNAEPDALAAVVGLTDISDPKGPQPSVFVTFRPDPSKVDGLAVALGIDPTGTMPALTGKFIKPLLHAWFHLQLTVDRSTQSIVLKIDGTDVLVQGSIPVFDSTTLLELSGGVFGFVNHEDMSVALDNIVLQVFPP